MLEVRKVRYRRGNRWATYYVGVLGEGPSPFEGPPAKSATKAKKTVLEAAGKVLSEGLSPRFYRFLSNRSAYYFLVVWREKYGWRYTILDPGMKWEPTGRAWGSFIGIFDSEEKAERAGRRHLAQLMEDLSTGYSAVEVIEDEQDKAEHLRLFEWACVAHRAKQAGLSNEQARNAVDLHKDRKLPVERAIELARQGYTAWDRLPVEA